jgi:hypothetical protein
MKVDEPNLSGASFSAGRTQSPASLSREESQRTTGARRPEVQDRVELSQLTGQVSQALRSEASGRSQRVAALAEQYGSHRYQPPAREVSQALVGESLAASAEHSGRGR